MILAALKDHIASAASFLLDLISVGAMLGVVGATAFVTYSALLAALRYVGIFL